MLASEGDEGGTGATVSREERQTHQREQGAADGRGDREQEGGKGDQPGAVGAAEGERQNWQQAGAALGNEKHR